MFKLTVEETNSLCAAVEYYDCAGIRTMYEKVGNIPQDTEMVVMSVDALRKIQSQIYELDDAAMNQTWQHGVLGDMSTINELCKE